MKALGGDISMFDKKKKKEETKSAIDPLNLGL